MTLRTKDIIPLHSAHTLHGLFCERVRRSPDAVAYHYFDYLRQAWCTSTWKEMAHQLARWQAALSNEGLQQGDRVAVMLRNCREWVLYEQAALSLGLIVVPLYTNDRADNACYILQHANAKVLLIEGQEHWQCLSQVREQLSQLLRIITLNPILNAQDDELVLTTDQWLPESPGVLKKGIDQAQAIATITYTSGTTGRPKGVMLSHHNILWNAHACLQYVPAYQEDLFLSFLPLSHSLERTAGYYLPMMAGSQVAYARAITLLAEDLTVVRPTVLISVPRIFERIYDEIKAQLVLRPALVQSLFRLTMEVGWQRFQKQQKRGGWRPSFILWPVLKKLVAHKILSKLGGRLRLAVCGGAPLSTPVGKVFIGLGLPLVQGYGLTETSPVISVNKEQDNDPASVGVPLPDVEVSIGDDQELLAKGPGITAGYWRDPQGSSQLIDTKGWLHSGDKARIEKGHLYIIGRIKEIIVLANGEKVPPTDMEMAIMSDPLFEQVMVIGEGRPYLSALVVLNRKSWETLAKAAGLDPDQPVSLENKDILNQLLTKIARQLHDFPGYARIHGVALSLEPWTVENQMITPTLKLRRNPILKHFHDQIEALYHGH